MKVSTALRALAAGRLPLAGLRPGRLLRPDADPKAELGWRPRWGNVEMFIQSYDWYLANRDAHPGREGQVAPPLGRQGRGPRAPPLDLSPALGAVDRPDDARGLTDRDPVRGEDAMASTLERIGRSGPSRRRPDDGRRQIARPRGRRDAVPRPPADPGLGPQGAGRAAPAPAVGQELRLPGRPDLLGPALPAPRRRSRRRSASWRSASRRRRSTS